MASVAGVRVGGWGRRACLRFLVVTAFFLFLFVFFFHVDSSAAAHLRPVGTCLVSCSFSHSTEFLRSLTKRIIFLVPNVLASISFLYKASSCEIRCAKNFCPRTYLQYLLTYDRRLKKIKWEQLHLHKKQLLWGKYIFNKLNLASKTCRIPSRTCYAHRVQRTES